MKNKQTVKLVGAFVLATMSLAPVCATAQSKPATAQALVAPTDTQWEYLVVSYGKALFDLPEKTLAYRSIGLAATAQEAVEMQRSLDLLGRFGWEVVTIVGAIGGDQEIVFKRRYDKARTANEATAITKGRDLYLKDLADIIERERRVREEAQAALEAERSKPRLIELEGQAAEEESRKLKSERQEKFASALLAAPWGLRSTFTIDSPSENFTIITLRAVVPEDLLINGNSYRRSDVTRWLKGTVNQSLKQALSSFPGELRVKVKAIINFNGKAHEVGDESFSYSAKNR